MQVVIRVVENLHRLAGKHSLRSLWLVWAGYFALAAPRLPACAMLASMDRRAFIALPTAAGLHDLAGGANHPPLASGPARQALDTRPLMFPTDFGAHPDSRIEWWYVTGALTTKGRGAAPEFGFQLTFFRLRTAVPADHPSRFAATQIIFAHAALSVLASRQLRHDQRSARAGFQIAEARAGDTDIWLRNWQLQRTGNADASEYRARVVSEAAAYALDLQLLARQPLLLQGIDGLSQKGPDPAQVSRYYSQPHLDAEGQLTLDGKQLRVAGKAWLDHEWSNSLLAAEAVGWDWIGINLTDGSALTAFRVRQADGSALYAGGSWRASGGATRNFLPGEVDVQATAALAEPPYPGELSGRVASCDTGWRVQRGRDVR